MHKLGVMQSAGGAAERQLAETKQTGRRDRKRRPLLSQCTKAPTYVLQPVGSCGGYSTLPRAANSHV